MATYGAPAGGAMNYTPTYSGSSYGAYGTYGSAHHPRYYPTSQPKGGGQRKTPRSAQYYTYYEGGAGPWRWSKKKVPVQVSRQPEQHHLAHYSQQPGTPVSRYTTQYVHPTYSTQAVPDPQIGVPQYYTTTAAVPVAPAMATPVVADYPAYYQ
eukprot:NODE_2676_length_656_cov_746.181219_g2205_i0.p1 GENE.NODE_2676_length_656_cov_746.181219_g2205_i0~~NODE_2676_length_656_cov_746.181219_g2205_i0.p1  ORF type:complete len:153 (+),score=16.28 NODE_2676_length_656_cov_746.181219_g2205_i0:2-460(+)